MLEKTQGSLQGGNNSQGQSIGSAGQLLKPSNVKDNGDDDFNLTDHHDKSLPTNMSSFYNPKSRGQQIMNKRQNMFSQLNKSPTIEDNEINTSTNEIIRKQKLPIEAVKEEILDEKFDAASQKSVNSTYKRRPRPENPEGSLLGSKQIIFVKKNTMEGNFPEGTSYQIPQGSILSRQMSIHEEDSKINSPQVAPFNANGELQNDSKKQQADQKRSQGREASIALSMLQVQKQETQVKKNVASIVSFAEEDEYHFFEVQEKPEQFAQFFQAQKEYNEQAKQNYEKSTSTYKSVLQVNKKLRRQYSKSSQHIYESLQESSNGSIEDTPQKQLKGRRRGHTNTVPVLSNFSKAGEESSSPDPLLKDMPHLTQSQKGKRDSGFGKLKVAYEKDNYIKRLSLSHMNLERFQQLIIRQESIRQKYQRIAFVFANALKNIITLQLIHVDSFEHSTIHFYSIALKYFKLFQNTTLAGTLFFLYCFFQVNDLNSEISWPITSSIHLTSDKTIFLSQQSSIVSHLGLALLVILLIQIFLSGVFSDSCLFTEKQAARLIFNSIKWNDFSDNKHISLKTKYKLYDKVMENKDIYEDEYPHSSVISLFFIELFLIALDFAALYYILDDQQLPMYLYKISIFTDYSILTHLVVGAAIYALILINQFVIEKTYFYQVKMSFSSSELFMMNWMIFNTMLIYVLFQYRQFSNFNDNLNLSIVNKSVTSNTTIVNQVQSQIGFVVAIFLYYLIKLISSSLVISHQDKYSFQLRRQNNKIPDTATTYPFDEMKKPQDNIIEIVQLDNKNNSNNEEIEIKNSVQIEELKCLASPDTQCIPTPTQPQQTVTTTAPVQINIKQANFKNTLLIPMNNNKSADLILESAFYGKHILSVSMLNSSLLSCIFSYPLILPAGLFLNFLVMFSLYAQTQIMHPSNCQTFLTKREFSSIATIIIYLFVGLSIFCNFLVGMSDESNSGVPLQESLFENGLSYILNNRTVNQLLYLITYPTLLYAVVFFLIATLYLQNKSHKKQFNEFKSTVSKMRGNITTQQNIQSTGQLSARQLDQTTNQF